MSRSMALWKNFRTRCFHSPVSDSVPCLAERSPTALWQRSLYPRWLPVWFIIWLAISRWKRKLTLNLTRLNEKRGANLQNAKGRKSVPALWFWRIKKAGSRRSLPEFSKDNRLAAVWSIKPALSRWATARQFRAPCVRYSAHLMRREVCNPADGDWIPYIMCWIIKSHFIVQGRNLFRY